MAFDSHHSLDILCSVGAFRIFYSHLIENIDSSILSILQFRNPFLMLAIFLSYKLCSSLKKTWKIQERVKRTHPRYRSGSFPLLTAYLLSQDKIDPAFSTSLHYKHCSFEYSATISYLKKLRMVYYRDFHKLRVHFKFVGYFDDL